MSYYLCGICSQHNNIVDQIEKLLISCALFFTRKDLRNLYTTKEDRTGQRGPNVGQQP